MRYIKYISPVLLAIAWLGIFSFQLSSNLPVLGNLLHPVTGFWANAIQQQQQDEGFEMPYSLLNTKAQVEFNDRLIPTISASSEEDLYFLQGYTHAYFRLWQMDMQYRAAGGFLSEVLGAKTLQYDRGQRRKGMVVAAQRTLTLMQQDTITMRMLTAYTNGVNAYINQMSVADYPVEYKLMNFQPSLWTPLKTAIIMKLLADDLTGKSDDVAMSLLKTTLPDSIMDEIFPVRIQDAQAVIPNSIKFAPPALKPAVADTEHPFADFNQEAANFDSTLSLNIESNKEGIGSNNWAFSGHITKSGQAILANDPHLALNLPSIWYENQLKAPGLHVYGVSIPGAPGVVIGFNQHIAWGFTNNYRDVKDYFDITYDPDDNTYQLDGVKTAVLLLQDTIRIKGENAFIDSIKYTVHGPIQYEPSFPLYKSAKKYLAQRWEALNSSNELLALYKMNRADNLLAFEEAIQYFNCPAQNFAYIDRSNNIAIWGQGAFTNKWPQQGRYVMRGDTKATQWGEKIPFIDVPKAINPVEHYVGSANQEVVNVDYPYWLSGNFTEFRSWALHYLIQQKIGKASGEEKPIDFDFSKSLQLSNYSFLAASLKDSFLATAKNIGNDALENQILDWDAYLDANSEIASLFQIWFQLLHNKVWYTYLPRLPINIQPKQEITMQLVLGKISQRYWDDINTEKVESFASISENMLQLALDSINNLKKQNGAAWYKVKNTAIKHLAKIPAFSYTEMHNGGWGNVLNAVKSDHGPSWRMIVTFQNDMPYAEVVYPGGQSGNPGSKQYNAFVSNWVNGKYYIVDWKH